MFSVKCLHGKACKVRLGGRTDLQISLWMGRRYHTFYHRLVGLTLLRCHWTQQGHLREYPSKIHPDWWGQDEAGGAGKYRRKVAI